MAISSHVGADTIPASVRGPAATDDDIYYAYRLLLGREPDTEGWSVFRRLIAEQGIAASDLAHFFMASAEFLARRSAAHVEGQLIEVALDGFSLFVRSDDRDVGRHIRTERDYEPHVTAVVRDLLRHGHVFVDVGANIGFFTNMAASLVGPGGFVVAVEPLDKNLQLLYRSLARNDFGHVSVHACAASDRSSLASIRTDPGTSNGQPLGALETDSNSTLTQTRRLDELTAGLTRLDLVKFDIDGFELLAWRGFRHTLERLRPTVLTEFHPYGMRTYVGIDPLDYLAELFAYGDQVRVLSQHGRRAIECGASKDVMRQWEAVNEAAGTDGTIHLDLLIQPRH